MAKKRILFLLVLLIFIFVGLVTQFPLALSQTNQAPFSLPEKTVNLQQANVMEWAKLPGIGPNKAKAIVTYREKMGFQKVEDLLKVDGIAMKTLEKIRPYILNPKTD